MSLRHGNKKLKRLRVLPQEKELDFESHDEYVGFTAPGLETFLMLAPDYQA